MRTKEKNKGRKSAVRALLFFVLFLTLSGAVILAKLGFDELNERRASVSFYDRLAKTRDRETTVPTVNTVAPDAADEETEETGETFPASEMDFDALRDACPDIVGWIQLDGTVIDYPVVQGEDNDFYLNHLADRTRNSAGAIMMEYTNDAAFGDAVTVLHGHHMRNGSMFAGLDLYRRESYCREHPMFRLYTPFGDHDVTVFAAYTVNGYSFGYPTSFTDEAEFDAFVEKAVSSTAYKTDVEVSYGDRLLLLSTCAYSFEGARYVVIGKIVE